MAGVLFLHRHHSHAIGAAFRRQIKIHNLRKLFLQNGHEYFVKRDAENSGFIRRAAGVGAVINGFATMRNFFYREYREMIHFIVITGVVAKRSFRCNIVGSDVALKDKFCRGRDLQIIAQAFHHFSFVAAQ